MSQYAFDPAPYEDDLRAIFAAIAEHDDLDAARLKDILRRHPKDGTGFFSKSQLVRGYRHLNRGRRWTAADETFLAKVRMKPVRTQSGVAPVTVLTKPFPCPGRCIFCPSDVRMPKSYLSDEPGAQRAAEHQFDPYRQTLSRLLSFDNTGHRVDKIELIILGGTWSFYPEQYQLWFVKRCFDAMNDYGAGRRELGEWHPEVDFRKVEEQVDGAEIDRRYNAVVRDFVRLGPAAAPGAEESTWSELEAVQTLNERAAVRCVGLVVETRPDHIDRDEVLRIRRLGATKVQIGFQSLDDAVLAANHRGHDVAATRRAVGLLRAAGFKIHAHWMPNLHGATPASDLEDFRRLWDDPDFRPDELKVYPCSLIESAELMAYHRDGRWRPYSEDELRELLVGCLPLVPPYCRVTRVVRDIPGTDIVVGNKVTNFRQVVENELREQGIELQEIRAREVGQDNIDPATLRLEEVRYTTGGGDEQCFLQFVGRVTGEPEGPERLAGFLRLQLPGQNAPVPGSDAAHGEALCDELKGAAIVREVHVYGQVVGLGARLEGRSQHVGLGTRLMDRAVEISAEAGFDRLAVISSVGTRAYYRKLGFRDGMLYQVRDLSGGSEVSRAREPARMGVEGLG